MTALSYAEAFALMFTLTPEETEQAARRVAEIADEHDDLGAGLRGAMTEIAVARAVARSAGGDA